MSKIFSMMILAAAAVSANSGSETTKRNYLNDPFFKQEKITVVNMPETWPQFYNRGPIDRSPKGSNTKIITLGTGTPAPNPYRYGAASALIVNGYPYFVDCGEAWWRGLGKASISQSGLNLPDVFANKNLKYMFITHLHEDHTVGLPSFISSPFKYGNGPDKKVYGPKGIGRMIGLINAAWSVDRNEMFQGPIHSKANGSTAVGIDIDPAVEFPGPVFEDDNVIVEAFRTKKGHGALRYTYAYRFTSKSDGRIVTFGGDGHYSEGLVKAAKDADVLVIEGFTFENIADTPWGGKTTEDKIRNVGAYHMFPKTLKRVQDESKVKRIVMIHEQNYNTSKDYSRLELLHEMEKAGVKNIESAMDGDLF